MTTCFLFLFTGMIQLSANENYSVVQQGINITGVVTEATGDPLPGVNVVVKGTSTGQVTDVNGRYSISVPNENATLQFSFVGYVTAELTVGNQRTISVELREDASQISEVVVVGFGVQKKENLTGSVSMVDMEKVLGDRPVTSVGQALQGAIPGLMITGDAIPGTEQTFNIRGTTSINGGGPLILVDNVPADISMINPEDIESISVLKDAASAAIYGARAAFGVILNTTKKAKKGTKFQLSYGNNFGFQKPINLTEQASVLEILETMQHRSMTGKHYSDNQDYVKWMDLVKQYNANPSAFPKNGAYLDPDDNKYYYLKDNNPQLVIFDKFGFQQTHNVSASGGTDKLVYRMSLGYTDQDGPLLTKKDSHSRVSLSSFISADITSWLNQSLDIRYAQDKRSYVLNREDNMASRSMFSQNARFAPNDYLVRTTEPDGPAYPCSSPLNYLLLSDPTRYQTVNPRIFSRTTIRPFKGLTGVFEYTFDKNDRDVKDFNSPFLMTTWQMGLQWSSEPGSGRYRVDKTTTNYSAINTHVTYSFDLQDIHNFSLMGGFSQEYNYKELLWSQRDGMINPDMPTLSGATDEIQSKDEFSEFTIRGVFYRVNYDYRGRYLFEANGRYDGSSRFPKKNRFGFFPSFSAGWQVMQENWMQWSKNWVNEFKLRVSWGQIGNQEIYKRYPDIPNNYPYIPDMASSRADWIYNGNRPITLGMPGMVRDDFTWENAESLNYGIDFRALNNKLSGTFDWYWRDTRGMLTRGAEFPSVVGATAPQYNAANLRSKGWEFSVSWRDRIGDWGYNVGFNIFDSRAHITKFENATGLLSERYVGQEFGEIWGYVTDRYYTIDDFDDVWQSGTWRLKEGVTSIRGNNTVRPGDIMFKNLMDTPEINSVNQIDDGLNTLSSPGDRKIIGNNTRRYQFGINLGANWKGFDLYVFLQGVAKRDAWIGSYMIFPFTDDKIGTIYSHQLDYWRPVDHKNGDYRAVNSNTRYPRLYDDALNYSSNYRAQTKYLSNAAYMRLKNITLRYSIPSKITQYIGLTSAKLFFSAENLYTWHSLPKGIDPERLNWGYPFYANYSFGLNITL